MEGILIGIMGNSLFKIIESFTKDKFGDKDKEVNKRIYEALEKTTKEFFDKYNATYLNPHDSFLAREKNIILIVKSLFYSSSIDLLAEIDRKGFGKGEDVSKEHLQVFLDILYKEFEKDSFLNKIITEKAHINASKIAFEDIKETKEGVKEILDKLDGGDTEKIQKKESKKSWELTDLDTGENMSLEEGKRYNKSFSNGVEYEYMLNGNKIYVQQKDIYGRISYHEIDIETGGMSNSKFAYPLSEYVLDIDQDEIVNRKIISFSKGYYEEILTLKWNRVARVNYDSNRKIQGIELSGGWSVLNDTKTIVPSDELNFKG